MNRPNYQVRRATVDDLAQLRKLWHARHFAAADLEKRLTEFQIVESVEGALLGCVGLQIEAQQARIHSEAYQNSAPEPELRLRLWERLQALARNHGLLRLWVLEDAEFWKTRAFVAAPEEVRAKLPEAFGRPQSPWLMLQLREESAAAVSLEREFDLFRQSQKELTDRAFRQARTLKVFAWILLFLAVVGVVLLGVWVFQHVPLPRRPR